LGAFDPSAEMQDAPVIGAPLTLGAARQLAAEALRHKARGHDPATLRLQARPTASESFGKAADAYAAHLKRHNRCWRQATESVNSIARIWASRQPSEITAHDLIDMVERCRRCGFPGRGVLRPGPSDSRARLAHSILSGLFSWAARTRRLERSPMAGLAPPRPATARERVLEDGELAIFWKACERLSPWHCAALRLLLVAGQRLREIAELRHDEIRDGTIHLAPSRTKNKRAHTVPLSPLAREIVAGVPRVEGSAWVFPSRPCDRPIGGWHLVKQKLDAEMRRLGWNGEPFVIHDLRRTAATLLARQGTPIHVTEKILNHASGTISGIAAVYNRHSYAAEMAEALERLGETIRELVAPRPSGAPGRPVLVPPMPGNGACGRLGGVLQP
jgi:integrase